MDDDAGDIDGHLRRKTRLQQQTDEALGGPEHRGRPRCAGQQQLGQHRVTTVEGVDAQQGGPQPFGPGQPRIDAGQDVEGVQEHRQHPYIECDEPQVNIGHEATASKVSDEQLFYLMSRGIRLAEAETMIVNGFIEPFTKELPLECAVELNRLIQLEMEGSVG